MSFRRPRRHVHWQEAAQRIAEPWADAYPRFYDLVRALEDHLEHEPDSEFAEVVGEEDGREYWMIETDGRLFDLEGDLPSVVLIYYFDDATVTVWNLRVEAP